ncbi:rhamnogalacturonan acetylesterase [Chitinophaga rhizophila]|uniref:Rhamnogalacturonan acetylesterase n=1 Tax=Chitinophaga rhizophila TaxID=2866212 RepID=A0ABS7GIT0_9BACT|nr:rhamnogalacturonan acetylesterase [Chitinophaga rhizophila]MBW8686684.1 rhamnogalacturonan acetylesterase [Chitinophaga rhizophila]
MGYHRTTRSGKQSTIAATYSLLMKPIHSTLIPFLLLAVSSLYAQDTCLFDFSNTLRSAGYTPVTAASQYNGRFGFDMGTGGRFIPGKGRQRGAFTTDSACYFSIAVPEGNYQVTAVLGSHQHAGATLIKAESRRLAVNTVKTAKGETKTVSFIVNVRSPRISSNTQVKLKPREHGKLDWDDKLTLEFSGPQPCISQLKIEKVSGQITVFLAGNSTVVDQEEEPWAAWGQMIPCFFKPGVSIANHAESGLTLGSFLNSGRLEKILSVAQRGDYLFIEFGHNDQKEKGPGDGAYYSYTERLKLFVHKAREKGVLPVIVTSTARRSFDAAGRSQNTLGDYPDAARKVAAAENIPLIDLNTMTTTLYDALGVEASKKALVHYPANTFPGQNKPLQDNTHFNTYGAYELAKCVVAGIRLNKLPLAAYLADMPNFDPAHPDDPDGFYWPLSPKRSVTKPDGN